MPKVFDWNGYRFHFFANEGDPLEPLHVHVSQTGAKAKFWLSPEVELAYNRGFDQAAAGSRRAAQERDRGTLE